MNRYLSIISLTILTCSIFFSCEKNNKYEKPTIVGEWTTEKRQLKTNYDFLDESFKNLFFIDNKDYIVKRIFTHTEGNTGSLETIAINRKTGNEDRKRSATYKIVKDSLHIDDEKFEQTISFFSLGRETLVSSTKLKKKDLDYIYSEIGGDPNLIPDDAEGVLEMEEIK